jgi:transketolase
MIIDPTDKQLQINIRKKILKMVVDSGEGHIASSFSIVEIMVSIYRYLHWLQQPKDLTTHTILSKGHAVYSLYGIMSELGELSDTDLDTVCQYRSYLIGHVPVKPEKNFTVGTGSLGQGLPMALGRAYARRLAGDPTPEFVIVGDGELNEGSCWETLLLMHKFPQAGLRVFVDNNHSSTRAIPMQNAYAALRAGWRTVDVDGHNITHIVQALQQHNDMQNLILICDTKKGYPLRDMIGNPVWHHRMPDHQEAAQFSLEIEQFYA